jgi:uncharacterized protein (TIGR02300 family)
VTKPELGTKRRCLSCNAPFFDLNRDPITCAKCGEVFTPVTLARSPPRRAWAHQAPTHEPAAVVEKADDDSESDLPEADDAADDSTLPPRDDDDDDDNLEVIGEIKPAGFDPAS